MREATSPQQTIAVALARYRIARAKQACERESARMLGQMDQKLVVARAERPEQRPFAGDVTQCVLSLPLAIDRVKPRDRRMIRQHRRRVAVDERVYFDVRRGALQR